MVEEDGISGVTSNPTIFEKAVAGSTDYDADLRELAAQGRSVGEMYDAITIRDVQLAADILRPIYEATQGADGFACLEVPPDLAYDTEGTIEAARRLFRALDRPNVMIKIPGTPQGVPAIEQCLSEGMNINVTLLFSVEGYERVALAYISALERLARAGQPLHKVASVASFFISRVDTLVDLRLEERMRRATSEAEREGLRSLLGRAGIANAKIAYARFKEIFSGPRWQALAQQGGRVQRPLWASTGTKNPLYRDVMYVEELIGPNTVNTLPQSTLDAFRDHGKVRPTLEEDLNAVRETMARIAEAGIDFEEVAEHLQTEGVRLFSDSFQKMLDLLAEKRETILSGRPRRYQGALGRYEPRVRAALAELGERRFTRRLWAKDGSLWSPDPAVQQAIRHRLGWLTVTEVMAEHCAQIQSLVQEIGKAGYDRIVLLGMGGSSLAPEVLARTFGARPGFPQLSVLDTTDPASILEVEHSLDLAKAMFIVSSKSGTTVETLSLYRYFAERVRAVKGGRAGENFIAITDPGTPLERLAREEGFRCCFLNPADIGGRYSALSYFGLVPAALAGIGISRLVDRAEALVQGCVSCVPSEENPGVWLGAVLGALATAGRDKVTFLTSRSLRGFGVWVEQLLAESTGKDGRGLVPVEGEAIGDPGVYGSDRLFVHLDVEPPDEWLQERVGALEGTGHPVISVRLADLYDLGQEFFRWEIATATAGALLGINPFDEPNVAESKENTRRLLEGLQRGGGLPEDEPILREDGLAIYCDSRTRSELGGPGDGLKELLAAHLGRARPGGYIALLAYIQRAPPHEEALQGLRLRLRDALRVATTLGFGPRYLHSTGQLHKGGPDTGLFLFITADDPEELPIPGQGYGFSTLKRAQALGDLRSLQGRGRRVLRIHLGRDVPAGLEALVAAVEGALVRAVS